jgi:hypothetical protein
MEWRDESRIPEKDQLITVELTIPGEKQPGRALTTHVKVKKGRS